MGLLTSFNAGVSGLQSSQAGLNTTAHNLANTKAPGYTRQQNINTDMYYQTFRVTDKSMMKIGYGTTISTVRQIRDKFLDDEYRLEAGRQSFYEVQYTTVLEIEDILGEMEGVEFADAWEDLWDTMQTLSTNPENITKRELFLAESEAFLEKATNVYDSLKKYQINLNTQIQAQVDAINEIADKIVVLNRQIADAEASGMENANDYRDARNLLMDELAKYTPYDAYEEYGRVTIRINNAPLVEDDRANHMKCEFIEIKEYNPATNAYELKQGSPMYTVRWERGGLGDVYRLDSTYNETNEADIGSLPGILMARGKRFGYYTDILQKVSDSPADQKLLQQYNATIGSSVIQRIEAQLDLMVHKVVTAVNDAFAPNVAVTDANGTSLLIDAAGNPISLTTAVTGVDLTGKKILDAYHCAVGADDDATMGTEVFTRRTSDRYQEYTLTSAIYMKDADGNDVPVTKDNGDGTYTLYVYNDEDPEELGSLYSIQNLEINPKLKANYSYLPVMGNPAAGKTGEYDWSAFKNAFETWQVKDVTLDPNALAKYGVEDYYDVMVASLGTEGKVWKGIVDHQTKMTESVEDRRQQISGVSTGEEMTFMLMYQHAYNASSRYITVIDEMLEHLIERLG
ncbi:hypothetical protein D7V86_00770 [bacterium D16-51]|nr:hypothetical protein D7V96_04550 [bacterium D16-59]RKI62766.1 hypothetical protein D7V86_00770 [bacterium D16-51]